MKKGEFVLKIVNDINNFSYDGDYDDGYSNGDYYRKKKRGTEGSIIQRISHLLLISNIYKYNKLKIELNLKN